MAPSYRTRSAAVAAAVIAVAAIGIIGLRLRLEDPLSNPIIPAEDPYTHMALVREHVRDGNIDPLYSDGRLYPPGMHAFVAAIWIFSGVDLYDAFLYGPAVLGALGLIGIAILVGRSEGALAASVAALALALAPEAIFRTAMMAPTALDLGLLPFLLYSLMRVLQGRLAWAGAAAPLAVFLLIAHPWVIAIVALAGFLFTILTFVHPWARSRGRAVTTSGLAVAIAIVGGVLALSLTGCGGSCGPGFRDVWERGQEINRLAPVFAAMALLAAGALTLARRRLDPFLARPAPETGSSNLRTIFSVGLLVLLVVVTLPAMQIGFPEHVHLERMFGKPILGLAILGLLMLPFAPSPAAHAGFAVAAATYPFVIYDPFDSPFWSHRTAVYLGVGLAILAATGTAAIARAVSAAFHGRPSVQRRGTFARPAFAVMPLFLVGVSFGGAVAIGTPPTYPGGWYRLFNECEMEKFRELAERVSPQERAIIVTGAWQSKLVLAAFTTNASRVWYSEGFFTDSGREEVLSWALPARRPIYAVVDRYLMTEQPGSDLEAFKSSPWRLLSECQTASGNTSLLIYALTGGRP